MSEDENTPAQSRLVMGRIIESLRQNNDLSAWTTKRGGTVDLSMAAGRLHGFSQGPTREQRMSFSAAKLDGVPAMSFAMWGPIAQRYAHAPRFDGTLAIDDFVDILRENFGNNMPEHFTGTEVKAFMLRLPTIGVPKKGRAVEVGSGYGVGSSLGVLI